MTLADDRHNISSPCYDDDLQFFRAIRQTRERQKKYIISYFFWTSLRNHFGNGYIIVFAKNVCLHAKAKNNF